MVSYSTRVLFIEDQFSSLPAWQYYIIAGVCGGLFLFLFTFTLVKHCQEKRGEDQVDAVEMEMDLEDASIPVETPQPPALAKKTSNEALEGVTRQQTEVETPHTGGLTGYPRQPGIVVGQHSQALYHPGNPFSMVYQPSGSSPSPPPAHTSEPVGVPSTQPGLPKFYGQPPMRKGRGKGRRTIAL